MIAYRAETAMVAIVREELARKDDARALLRDLFRSEADLLPDTSRGVLEVHVHPMANAQFQPSNCPSPDPPQRGKFHLPRNEPEARLHHARRSQNESGAI